MTKTVFEKVKRPISEVKCKDAGSGQPYSSRYLWYVIILLTLVNVVNYADRMLLSVLLPHLKEEFSLSDTQLGLLSGFAFAVMYAVFGIPIARIADVWVRKNVIAIALVVWSGMTAVCGAAMGFWTLLLTRIGVGIGEAGCIPPSHSMISDYFPASKRSSVLSIYTAGASIGIILGLTLGGILVAKVGWRWTFFAFATPGLVLAVLVLKTLKEPRRGVADRNAGNQRGSAPFWVTLKGLLKNRSYIHLVGFFAFGNLSGFGFNQWLPSYYGRSFGLSSEQIGVLLGIVLGFSGVLGGVLGGYIADRLIRSNVQYCILMGIITTLLSIPFLVGVSLASTAWVALTCNFLAVALSNFPYGANFALIQGITAPRSRALATAFAMFCASIIGIGGGPLLTGLLSDMFLETKANESLRQALFYMSFVLVIPAVNLIFLYRTIRGDLEISKPES